MKFIINKDWGGFSVPEAMQEHLHCGRYPHGWEDISIRTNEDFIAWVLDHDAETSLAVVEISDYATDWRIEEYDGMETVWTVVDGKMIPAPIVKRA